MTDTETERTPTPQEVDELRTTAIVAFRDWLEAGVKAGREPMMMLGQLSAEMQKVLS